MKGKKLMGITIVLVVLIIGAKSGPANVFDDTVPLNKSAILQIDPAFTVKSYNSIDVKLKMKMSGTEFAIPAGNAVFAMDLDTGRMFPNVRYIGKVDLTYNFEEGKEYFIKFWFATDNGELKKVATGYPNPSIFIFQDKKMKNVLAVFKLDLNK